MQSNKECMKDILRYVINNTKIKIEDNNNISILSVGITDIISELAQDDKYGNEEVAYNILKCHKHSLVDANIQMDRCVVITEDCNIYDITIKGEKFLNDELDLM